MSGPCCIQGSVHSGEPAGRVETIHGLKTYVTDPPNGAAPKAIVVMIPDAFGWDFVNLRLLGDIYAKRSGAKVLMPDFMDGHACDPAVLTMMDVVMTPAASWLAVFMNKIPTVLSVISHFVPFMYHNRLSVTEPRVREWFSALRTSDAASGLKIGATGYCWGGKFVTLFCHPDANASNGQPLIDCGFTAHPSNLTFYDDIEKVERPLSIAVGDNDFQMSKEQGEQTKKILEQDKPAGRHQVNIMPGAKHGFSVRGHPDDKKELEQAQDAEDQAVTWFHKHLGTNKP